MKKIYEKHIKPFMPTITFALGVIVAIRLSLILIPFLWEVEDDSGLLYFSIAVLVVAILIGPPVIKTLFFANKASKKYEAIKEKYKEQALQCSFEYDKVAVMEDKYKRYMNDMQLFKASSDTNSIKRESYMEPTQVLIKYAHIEPTAECQEKLLYCIRFLEMKAELQALIVDFGHLIENEFTDKERQHLNLERVAQHIVDVPVIFFIKDTCKISDTNPKSEEYISFDITERMLKDLYEFYKPMFEQNSI